MDTDFSVCFVGDEEFGGLTDFWGFGLEMRNDERSRLAKANAGPSTPLRCAQDGKFEGGEGRRFPVRVR